MSLLKVELVESELDRFRSDFDLPSIPIILLPTNGNNTLGSFCGDHIKLFVGHSLVQGSEPRAAAKELTNTLLHELRHHWQAVNDPTIYDDKPGAYWGTAYEIDARDFAEKQSAKYRLVRCVRKAPLRSGFTRLGQTQRNIRRNV